MKRIDATMLADAQWCLQAYFYKHEAGWTTQTDSVDLIFGHLLDESLEILETSIASGASVDDALLVALRHALKGSCDEKGPRFGTYQPVWHCTGTTKFVNESGNAAKCPFSHKGKFFPLPAPPQCRCGSPTEETELWMPTKPGKDVDGLVNLIVEYADSIASRNLVPAVTKTVSCDGKVESKPILQSFWEVPYKNGITICGTFDAVKQMGEEVFVVDFKSTGKNLSSFYWKQFMPNTQVELYNWAAQKLLDSVTGVSIEAFSSTASGTELGFRLFRYNEERSAEFMRDVDYWLERIEEARNTNYWPRNRTNCSMCRFQKVCSADPSDRQSILEADYIKAKWNPETRTKETVS